MTKVWLIAGHQFKKEASKRSFLVILLLMPLVLTLMIGLGYLFSRLERDSTTLGFVDEAGLLVETMEATGEDEVNLLAYETVEEARAALDASKIDAFYVLPDDYPESHRGELVYQKPPPTSAVRHFRNVLRLNLLADQPPVVAERALSGANVTVLATESGRVFHGAGPSAGQLLPLAAAAIFAFLVMTTSGYMLEVVVEEKENRTMEILVTSVSPGRMMTGKILGALAIALLQLLVWVVFLVVVVWLGRNVLDVAWLRQLSLNWRDVSLLLIVAAPTYLFIGALMTAIGSTLVDNQEAQQVGPLSFLILFLPIYLLLPIANNPDGPLAMVLSLIPGTSVTTLALRSLFVEVPAWQFAAAGTIALLLGVLAVWLAGKAFRVSMLRYGQRLGLRELLSSDRSKHDPVTAASPTLVAGGSHE